MTKIPIGAAYLAMAAAASLDVQRVMRVREPLGLDLDFVPRDFHAPRMGRRRSNELSADSDKRAKRKAQRKARRVTRSHR